ncbi:diguanylate cyclase (GGDEF) domain-containing protein [Pseudobutyrivibrio sp. UC1225]|uniref:GGDEF domain-containing protein n=1 Tax=Pseudobutyrivibrio sp. UC1225 TaxID=1798185 RepID=UPI0008E9C512|nr:GGDEF domain-containing protein [Pseudobutyrivibrio sp. UC1225]SFO30937.1 diguanylate cyclase (GGDEF) domain-containing protein [Pseudobutyrivibrio sp. UC1225]
MKQGKNIFSFHRKLNNVMLVIAIVGLIICYMMTRDVKKDETSTSRIEPYQVALLEDGSKEYFIDLSSYDSQYSGLVFFTAHQSVTVYNAGHEIYSFTKTGGFWGSTPGAKYNFVSINEKMQNVAVILTPAYDIVSEKVPEFYIGNTYQIYSEFLRDSIPRLIASIFIVIFSLTLFAYYIFMNKRLNLGKDLIYLGYFSLFIGVWSTNETIAWTLVSENRIFDSIIPYICLMLSVPPFVLFFDSYLGINGKIIKKIILWASMVEFITVTSMHFLKIREFRENLMFVQLMITVAVAYVVGAIILQLLHRDFSRQVIICTIGVSLFLIAMVVDVINYYRIIGDADRLGRYMVLIFVLLLAWDLIRGTNELIEKGRRARQLEIFALTDSMTGLYNRNAFESQAESDRKLDGIIAVVADANGLKACNDTYGHEAGDEYITLVAEIFNGVFGRYGTCYRTGGDEFCCIIPSSKAVNMERLKKLFMTKIYTANLEGKYQYSIGVAIGAAMFDSELDKDFRALVKRADESMYENKKASKTV